MHPLIRYPSVDRFMQASHRAGRKRPGWARRRVNPAQGRGTKDVRHG
jgi:hypothetical protein